MKYKIRKICRLFIILLFLSGNTMPVLAALYWASANNVPLEQGIRSKYFSVCFIGDAVTARPDRVKQIVNYIEEFEYAANIKFVSIPGKPLRDESNTDIKNLVCSPSTKQQNGNDYYDGDIRVVIPNTNVSGTGPVPGNGCLMFRYPNGTYTGKNDGWGSWSNAPWDLTPNRACQYNLKLGDDPLPSVGNPPSSVPYLNHALHEFGHALGLAHEHERADVNAPCTETGYGGSISSGLMTSYDRKSVMHYQFLSCGINGNYDNTGLSDLDRLALHILYPEDNLVAEYVGTTVIRTTDTLTLQSAWKARGANMDFVAKDFNWKIESTSVSTTPDLSIRLKNPGDYTFEFSYNDFLGRKYSYTGIIHVLEPANYNKKIAANVAALLPLITKL